MLATTRHLVSRARGHPCARARRRVVNQARSAPVVRVDTRAEEAMGFRRRQGQHPLQLADHPDSDQANRLRGGARTRPFGTPGPHARVLVYPGPGDAGLRGTPGSAAAARAADDVVTCLVKEASCFFLFAT